MFREPRPGERVTFLEAEAIAEHDDATYTPPPGDLEELPNGDTLSVTITEASAQNGYILIKWDTDY